jgi:hypothetical protein
MTPTLENIITEQTQEPVELPRLTVQATFLTYGRIGTALEQSHTAFKAIPEQSTPQATTESLKEIVKCSEAIIRHANRLMEGNR